MTRENLRRGLRSYQLSMISIGGVIGVGMFLGAGAAVSMAGPAIILAYVLGGAVMFAVMLALGEMTVSRPAPGAFRVHADMTLGSYVAFLTGWLYYFSWLGTMAAETVAATTYLDRWFPHSVSPIIAAGMVIALTLVNLAKVESFGTFEFWFASIKVLAIILFILTGAALIVGFPGHPGIGTRNYLGQGGFAPNGIGGLVRAMALVMVAYGGTEVIGVAAGETKDPATSVPQAVRGIALRTLILYVGSMTILVGIIPWHETGLRGSPFVLAYDALGIPRASDIMNVVVLTAALSSLNAGIYTSSRMLYSLALESTVVRALAYTSSRTGIPSRAVIASTISVYFSILLYYLFPGSAFLYVTSIASFGFLFVWLVIALSHVRWRKVVTKDSEFKAPFYPYLSIISSVFIVAFIGTLWAVPEQRVGLYAGLSMSAILTAGYGLQRATRYPAIQKVLPGLRPRAESPTAAGTALSLGLALATYFGLVSREVPPG
ncbi:MAG TPA: amino acid permease [Firmicutes bacterium]|nr:amino acid permease [Candidatus Fermentithermobacillaceae bacterium]